ncbi:MAG: hypothetical protein NTU53_17325 [Planctomycetota bacterium]|nr:hypothetical protein [Planctomycetota bacterium]
MLRGGSWNNNPRNCRSANHNRNNPDNQNDNNGFRVAAIQTGTITAGGDRNITAGRALNFAVPARS